MKLFDARRRPLSVAALLVMLFILSIIPAYAQSDAKDPNAPAQVQYSTEEIESLRGRFLEVVDTLKDFTQTLKPGDVQTAESLARYRSQIEGMSAKELNTLRATFDPSKMNAGLGAARATLDRFKPGLGAYHSKIKQSAAENADAAQKGGGYTISSAGFPDVPAPDDICAALIGSGRPSSALVIATEAVYTAAKIVDVALNRACNQVAVAVILGEGGGGNTSLLCVASDVVLLAAETVRDKVRACDEDYNKRLIDASVSRLAHVHGDIESSVANDNANTTTITGAVTTATSSITGNDNTNKNTIVANDNTNKTTIVTAIGNSQGAIVNNANGNTTAITTAVSNAQTSIVANDNINKTTIVANDNANTSTLIANANANATMLRDLLLRTQIEADLSSADGATFVGIFETPANVCGAVAPLNQCGLLGLVRQIVVQTISNLAGKNATQANSFLAAGDQYSSAGNYKSAYQSYRQAYKAAVK